MSWPTSRLKTSSNTSEPSTIWGRRRSSHQQREVFLLSVSQRSKAFTSECQKLTTKPITKVQATTITQAATIMFLTTRLLVTKINTNSIILPSTITIILLMLSTSRQRTQLISIPLKNMLKSWIMAISKNKIIGLCATSTISLTSPVIGSAFS